MDLSKIQIIALVVVTTILTDKFLVTHPPQVSSVLSATSVITPTISLVPSVTTAPSISISPQNLQDQQIIAEIQRLRQEVALLSNKPTTAVAPTNSPVGGMVKISSSQWKRVDVFEKPLASSKIINSIAFDEIYFYSLKANNWYLLNLDTGQSGYVQASFLKEFP